jgi:uncharacterized protein YxjI
MSLERFTHDTYVIRKKFFKIFGEDFQLFDPRGDLVLFSKLKAFRLKEDIRLYEDESMGKELLAIKARGVIDFSMGYDVIDSETGGHVGVLKRKGFKSMLRDEWIVCDPEENEIGSLREDSQVKALVRRFVEVAAFFMPQKYHLEIDGQRVAEFTQGMNPIIQRLTLDFTPDTDNRLDPRLGIAAGVLIAAIEGRQSE